MRRMPADVSALSIALGEAEQRGLWDWVFDGAIFDDLFTPKFGDSTERCDSCCLRFPRVLRSKFTTGGNKTMFQEQELQLLGSLCSTVPGHKSGLHLSSSIPSGRSSGFSFAKA